MGHAAEANSKGKGISFCDGLSWCSQERRGNGGMAAA